jgi:hypothetical protein
LGWISAFGVDDLRIDDKESGARFGKIVGTRFNVIITNACMRLVHDGNECVLWNDVHDGNECE